MRLPPLLVSSVVRGTRLGESHGGLFLLDPSSGRADQKLDWNRTDIDVSGRGGDRGLRGIAFHGDRIVVAANSEILVLDREFRWIDTYTNRYLGHCHEICVRGDLLYVTSTGFDSILVLDLHRQRFVAGLRIERIGGSYMSTSFDPLGSSGPPPAQALHLNCVAAADDGVTISGLRVPALLHLRANTLTPVVELPGGTHNAQLLGDALIYNDTERDRIVYATAHRQLHMPVPRYPEELIRNPAAVTPQVARPGFARGLCLAAPGIVAGGSSPSTISLYELGSGERLASHAISMDVRNAIHGLAPWPFA